MRARRFRAQKSHVDRSGWDFLLECEPLRCQDRPLDGQNDLPKFLIQVKSTEHERKAPRIKLSALKHLVDADLPAAVVVVFFAKGARIPTRGLLVPVDDALITETLRRVRREEARGNRSIHKTTIPVPLDRAIEIEPTGEGLSGALNAMIGGEASTYIAEKIPHCRTCGFEDKSVVGTFFVPGEEAAKKSTTSSSAAGSHRDPNRVAETHRGRDHFYRRPSHGRGGCHPSGRCGYR